jgi:hypothetical protein
VARCAERKGGSPSHRPTGAALESPPRKKRWGTLAALAAALLVAIGGAWIAINVLGTKPQPQAAAAAVIPAPAPPAKVVAAPDGAQTQLTAAAQALAAGRITETGGALELYRNILASDPNNAAARSGLHAVGDQLLTKAEQSLLEEDLDDVQAAIAQVREIDEENPRLSFLGTQLARERERQNLRQQRLRRLVAEARSDMQAGNLLGWVSGGAVDALLEARKIDPRDTEVVEGIHDLTAALVDATRKAAAAGDTQRARSYTTAAVRLGVSRQVLTGMERSLTESRLRDSAGANDVGAE